MKITVVGRGNVGGGLARLWTAAGHDVTTLGRDGGDAAGSDVVVVAVPGETIAAALGRVTGLAGQVTIDASNVLGPRDEVFPSLAHQVKSIIGGPTAKSFSTNFAAAYDQISAQRVAPSNLFAADSGARSTAEQLIRDTGYEPVFIGDLDTGARLLENGIRFTMTLGGQIGPFFYRIARPGEL